MKTNFISNLKQLLFLFIAVFTTVTGYSQTNQNSTNVDIGGGKSSDTGLGLFNIGGSQGVPRDKDGGMIISQLSTKTDCIFGYPTDIGGKDKPVPIMWDFTIDDDDFHLYDIGGGRNSTGGLSYKEIGGHGTKGTSTTMMDTYDDDFFPSDIGGRGGHGGRGTSTGGELTNLIDTGGRGSTGTGQYDDDDTDPYDIGGKSTTGGLGNYSGVIAYLEYIPGSGCDIETGGRNGTGTSTGDNDSGDDYDTGGRGSNGNTGEQFVAFTWHCPDFH